MSDLLLYDERIWREIQATVEPKIAGFLTKVQREIAADRSLDRLPSKQQIIWQRADKWVQCVYDICRDAYRGCGHEISIEFDRVVWAFCLEPFILADEGRAVSNRLRLKFVLQGSTEEPWRKVYIPSLLELLLPSIGSSPEKDRSLQVRDKHSCLNIRTRLYETWRKKLLRLTAHTQLEEAAAALSRYHAIEERARRVAAGLPPEPLPQSLRPEPDQHAAVPANAAAPIIVDTQPSSGEADASATAEHTHITAPASTSTEQTRRIPGAEWEDIQISFLSDERLQIHVGSKRETHNYAELGFADRRNGKPNQAWVLLRALAEHRGIIRDGRDAGLTWPKVEKRVQKIRTVLREHFDNPTDPIPFIEGTGYQARFIISCAPSYRT